MVGMEVIWIVFFIGPFDHHHVFSIQMNGMACAGPFDHHHAILNVFSVDLYGLMNLYTVMKFIQT